jgi:hypothetical protein
MRCRARRLIRRDVNKAFLPLPILKWKASNTTRVGQTMALGWAGLDMADFVRRWPWSTRGVPIEPIARNACTWENLSAVGFLCAGVRLPAGRSDRHALCAASSRNLRARLPGRARAAPAGH